LYADIKQTLELIHRIIFVDDLILKMIHIEDD